MMIEPVAVEADGWRYPRHRLQYVAPVARIVDGTGHVWATAVVVRIDQDDQHWRVVTDAGVWDVTRAVGCCGSRSAPELIG